MPELQQILGLSERADFCLGYFTLRGWKELDSFIDRWPGDDGHQCRLLVGMQRLPQEELHEFLRVTKDDDGLDSQTAVFRAPVALQRVIGETLECRCVPGWLH